MSLLSWLRGERPAVSVEQGERVTVMVCGGDGVVRGFCPDGCDTQTPRGWATCAGCGIPIAWGRA